MATLLDFLENVFYSICRLWMFICVLIIGLIYCLSLKNLNEELLFNFEPDDYIGMMAYNSGIIWKYFFMAVLLVIVFILLIFFTIKYSDRIIDSNIYTLVLFILSIILILVLAQWLVSLIYVPIFKAVVVGLGLLGIIGTAMNSSNA